MWPSLTGEQFFEALRRAGWTLIIEGDIWWANWDRGAVKRRLRFQPETVLSPEDVEDWASDFGLTPNDL
jgi:hypothetical protein